MQEKKSDAAPHFQETSLKVRFLKVRDAVGLRDARKEKGGCKKRKVIEAGGTKILPTIGRLGAS